MSYTGYFSTKLIQLQLQQQQNYIFNFISNGTEVRFYTTYKEHNQNQKKKNPLKIIVRKRKINYINSIYGIILRTCSTQNQSISHKIVNKGIHLGTKCSRNTYLFFPTYSILFTQK